MDGQSPRKCLLIQIGFSGEAVNIFTVQPGSAEIAVDCIALGLHSL